MGVTLMTPFYLMRLAEVYAMAAQPEEGLKRLAEAAKLIETTQERWVEARRLNRVVALSAMRPRAVTEFRTDWPTIFAANAFRNQYQLRSALLRATGRRRSAVIVYVLSS
jgi:hypothetical protein